MRIRRALISVTDKKGIITFAKTLESLGVEIISTGGTAKVLKENGVRIIPIEEFTGMPEMMDGRVKSLHPKVHGGILAVRENKKHMDEASGHGINMIDLVVVNLYQFSKAVQDSSVALDKAIENIDIGGPALVRSSAKNYKDVVIVTDPEDYGGVIEQIKSNGDVDLPTRETLALKAFRMTGDYDGEIEKFFSRRFAGKDIVRLAFSGGKELRYGENWHQKARIYASESESSIANANQLQGKEMSYNNYLDAESALEAAHDLKIYDSCGAVIIKHNNPCGYATGASLRDALENAWKGDPLSAFGSVIALTRPMDKHAAEFIADKFVEIIIAPGFVKEAVEMLKEKKNLRLLEMPDFSPGSVHRRFLAGALLVQDRDDGYADKKDFRSVSKIRFPEDKTDLAFFACLACKHTKSNAVVIAREYKPGFFQVVGMGAGQPNRITSLKIAIEKAKENFAHMNMHEREIAGCVLASDSFFPFSDSIEEASKHGVHFIVQPGGSVKDGEVIEACDRHGIAMAFTGRRMFKH
jgi:phosphoribosylaminoimidazolecarboxamide formyltransferase/IMP cyclohydrolase